MSKKFFFVKYFIFILVLGVLFFALNLRRGFAQNVTINLVVVNGSEEPKETPIKYFLPSELKPEDIIEKGSLDLDYDKDKARHFVFGSARLEPKESRTIKLTTKDVWRIDESEINIIKTQLEQNLTALEQTEFYSSATILRDGVMQKLNYIAERQQRFSDNIERRIEEYRANLEMFNEIKKNVFSSDYLKSNIAEPQTEGTIRFVIEAEMHHKTKSRPLVRSIIFLEKFVRIILLMIRGLTFVMMKNASRPILPRKKSFSLLKKNATRSL